MSVRSGGGEELLTLAGAVGAPRKLLLSPAPRPLPTTPVAVRPVLAAGGARAAAAARQNPLQVPGPTRTSPTHALWPSTLARPGFMPRPPPPSCHQACHCRGFRRWAARLSRRVAPRPQAGGALHITSACAASPGAKGRWGPKEASTTSSPAPAGGFLLRRAALSVTSLARLRLASWCLPTACSRWSDCPSLRDSAAGGVRLLALTCFPDTEQVLVAAVPCCSGSNYRQQPTAFGAVASARGVGPVRQADTIQATHNNVGR